MAHFYNTCSDSITDNVSLTYITRTLIHRGNMDIKRFRIRKNGTKVLSFFIKQHTEQQHNLSRHIYSQSVSYDTVIELKGKTVRLTRLTKLKILEG